MAEKIVFVGDFCRPNASMSGNNQTTNILWLWHLLAGQLRDATGLPTSVLLADGEEFGFPELYADAQLPVSNDSWARLYGLGHPSLDAKVHRACAGALVIGFELSPSIKRALTVVDIPFVDGVIHPVRFMDDIFLAIEASWPEAARSLERHAVSSNR